MGLKLAAIMALLMFAMGGLGYWYFQDSQAKLALLHANNAKLETATKIQTNTINQLQADFKLASKLAEDTTKMFNEAREQIGKVQGAFNKQSKLLGSRDIGKLAVHKPKSIRRITNKGSKNIMRCFEIASGQPLTEKEQNAEKKSQTNSSCPGLANPNRVLKH